MDAFASVGASTNKNVRSAWASFLVNLSLLLTTESQADSDGGLIAMSAVAELLDNSPKDDSETMFRHGRTALARSSAQKLAWPFDSVRTRLMTCRFVIGQESRPRAEFLWGCRALVAAGTLMQRNEEAKGLARDLGVPDFAHQLSRSGDTRVVKVAGEVLSLL